MLSANKLLAQTVFVSTVSLSATIGFSTLASAQISEQYFVRQTVIDSSAHLIPSDSSIFPHMLHETLCSDENSAIPCPPSVAIATSRSETIYDGFLNAFVGNVEVAGFARVSPPDVGFSIAESEAIASFVRIGTDRSSTIKIKDPIIKVGGGETRGGEARDTISFSIQDPDTEETILEGTFLDIIADLQGALELDDVASFTGVTEGVFSINLDSPFINTSGSLLAEFKDGILTTSNDSGIFDGLLPSVGSLGTFNFSMPKLEFSYDLPCFDENVLFFVDSRVSGSARVVVPEPLTIFGTGMAICFGAAFKRKLKRS